MFNQPLLGNDPGYLLLQRIVNGPGMARFCSTEFIVIVMPRVSTGIRYTGDSMSIEL